MEIILTLIFSIIAFVLFIFLVFIPLIGLYIGFSTETLDEEKYNLEGARYLDGR